MTAEMAPRPTRPQGVRQRMVRSWILLASAGEVLRDRRFQEKVIMAAIVAAALAELGRDNQARPLRRAATWYRKAGVGHEVARVREALEPGKRRHS